MNFAEFVDPEEQEIAKQFLKNGYVIFPLDQAKNQGLQRLKEALFKTSVEFLNLSREITLKEFYDNTHHYVKPEQLNALKLKLIPFASKDFQFHPSIYHMAKKHIDYIVGNEVCMQRTMNLSIQLPQDESALLPLHTDVWSGNSPYEVVLWMPLVDCYKTKSMYVLPIEKSQQIYKNFVPYVEMDAESFYKSIEKDVIFLEVPEGHAVIFSHSILHGNRINDEALTRWTFNIRFKSAFSPYGTKDLGEAFVPITLKPITRVGFDFIMPKMAGIS